LRSASPAQHRHGFEQATGENSTLMTDVFRLGYPWPTLSWTGRLSAEKAVTRGLAIERPPQELAVAKRTQERDLGLKITGNPGNLGEIGR